MKTDNVKYKYIDDEQVAYAIINRKRYSTATSELLATYEDGFEECKIDAKYVEKLFRTKKGTFFLYAIGGPDSLYGEYNSNGGYDSGHILQVMTPEEACEWAENRGEYDVIDSHFADQIEEG